MAGGGKYNFQKILNESMKSTRTSLSKQTKKEYGENYKSRYSHTVGIAQRHSAPVTSTRKSRQRRRTLEKERMSPYSRYSLMKRQEKSKKSGGAKDINEPNSQKSQNFGGFYIPNNKSPSAKRKSGSERNKIRFSLGSGNDPKQSVVLSDEESFSTIQLQTRDWHYHRPRTSRRSITFRDGSIDMRIDMGDMLSEAKKDEDWDWDDDEDDKLAAQKSELMPEDSIISIRHIKLHREETLEEYNKSWKHFFEFYTIELIIALILIVLTLVFIFVYNYGFTTSGSLVPEIKIHDESRALLNAHMLLMIIPNSILLGIGVLTYRTFRTISRTHTKWLHGGMSIVASICFSFGIYYCVVYHRLAGTPDLNSLHNCLGLFCCAIQVLQLITGFVYMLPCCSWDTRVSLTPLHKMTGGILLMGHGASILTGCVNMTNKYFDTKNFPQYYPYPLWIVQPKSAVMNFIGIFTIFFVTNTLYIQGNFHFRRRVKPGPETGIVHDPDADAMSIATTRRQSVLLAKEAMKPGGDDAQIGSRQSFNLRRSLIMQPHSYSFNNQDRTIPMMLNGLQQHKSNFTDADCEFDSIFNILRAHS
ncbi:unnamed protein product [Orchesella dallaii]|uniref:Cytochrome b561 domain-containing protein n=1 Tax=Orchesella dallaii TaxID=48710 RepID=A0ABP1QJ08_9HEXA